MHGNLGWKVGCLATACDREISFPLARFPNPCHLARSPPLLLKTSRQSQTDLFSYAHTHTRTITHFTIIQHSLINADQLANNCNMADTTPFNAAMLRAFINSSHGNAVPSHSIDAMLTCCPDTALTMTDVKKNRLDCLRALKAQEIEQRILDRLAGLAHGERIPDELIIPILEILAQRAGQLHWGKTGSHDYIFEACRTNLGPSQAADLLSGRLEKIILNNNTQFMPVSALGGMIRNKQHPYFHHYLANMRHLQLQLYLPRDGKSPPVDFNFEVHRKQIESTVSSIRHEHNGFFANLRSVRLQIIIVDPDRDPPEITLRILLAKHFGLGPAYEKLLEALKEIRDAVREKKGKGMELTFQKVWVRPARKKRRGLAQESDEIVMANKSLRDLLIGPGSPMVHKMDRKQYLCKKPMEKSKEGI